MTERVQSGTDRITLNIGSLQSQIDLELHTYHAARLWNGRKPKTPEKNQGVPGLTDFLRITNNINIAAAQDDPYADWMIITIEERILKAKEKLAAIKEQVKQVFESIPKQLSISENLNISPARMPLFVFSPLGFQGVYLLVEFDELARDLLLAKHIGLLGRDQMEGMLDQAGHQIRSTFALTQNYRHTGVSRDDVAANNARAREAIEKFGLPPQDILERQRRSALAPQIHRKSGAVPEQEVVTADDSDVASTVRGNGAGSTHLSDAGAAAIPETTVKPVRKTRAKAAEQPTVE
ncbi:MAG: TIGR03761 family integrating conjugative element protein [Burkholderiales bacterium]|jgi:integrating conjugative element protein (TIGR03761 family)|nr:TIGR03761 family integrating conjugative element protein [Burkholderiales bacterium]